MNAILLYVYIHIFQISCCIDWVLWPAEKSKRKTNGIIICVAISMELMWRVEPVNWNEHMKNTTFYIHLTFWTAVSASGQHMRLNGRWRRKKLAFGLHERKEMRMYRRDQCCGGPKWAFSCVCLSHSVDLARTFFSAAHKSRNSIWNDRTMWIQKTKSNFRLGQLARDLCDWW